MPEYLEMYGTIELIKGGDNDASQSDCIGWNECAYKVVKPMPWRDAGFYVAFAEQVNETI